jgi:DNA polymerase
MNTTSNTAFLKEMGITEWASRDATLISTSSEVFSANANAQENLAESSSIKISEGTWYFFGNTPQGEADLLFQGIIRALGLSRNDWLWKNLGDPLPKESSENGLSRVAFAFGAPTAQKLSGERDDLSSLRETILSVSDEFAEDIPLIASFDLAYLIGRPKEKALLWQDLLLAKSVLQNL